MVFSFDDRLSHGPCKILKNILKRIPLTLWLSSEVVSNTIVNLFSPLRFSIPAAPCKEGQKYQQSCQESGRWCPFSYCLPIHCAFRARSAGVLMTVFGIERSGRTALFLKFFEQAFRYCAGYAGVFKLATPTFSTAVRYAASSSL